MSALTLPPPQPSIVLTRTYKSRGIKGGTVIAEDVLDLESHERRLLDPDDYRAVIGGCSACGGCVIHALCFRERLLRPADLASEALVCATVRMFRCAHAGCRAVITVLPAFIARHLWRVWGTVQAVTRDGSQAPKTTRRRWCERLQSSAFQLTQILAALAASFLPQDFRALCAQPLTRDALLEASNLHALLDRERPLAAFAAWIHRLAPGVRLM